MRKLLLIGLLFLSAQVFAQNINVLPLDDNVGIGTVNPNDKLHIEAAGGGILRLSNNNTSYLTSQNVITGNFRSVARQWNNTFSATNTNETSSIRFGYYADLQGRVSSAAIRFYTQDNASGSTFERMSIIGEKVGIGTSTPGLFNSNTSYQIFNSDNVVLDIQGGDNSGWLSVGSNVEKGVLGGIAFTKPNGQPDAHRQIAYIRARTSLSSYNTPNSTLEFATKGAGYLGDPDMVLTSSGSLGIGTETTGNHKLAVEGTIGAREIVVESGTWSDFVFEPDYDLPTLQEVENFIDQNGHLPDIPSAEEVEENGISLVEMDAKLFQKIEELTLYVIEQQKELKDLKKENESLMERIDKLETKN